MFVTQYSKESKKKERKIEIHMYNIIVIGM